MPDPMRNTHYAQGYKDGVNTCAEQMNDLYAEVATLLRRDIERDRAAAERIQSNRDYAARQAADVIAAANNDPLDAELAEALYEFGGARLFAAAHGGCPIALERTDAAEAALATVACRWLRAREENHK